jgi:hypothetical protein
LIFSVGGVVSVSAALVTLWVMLSFNSVWLATGLYLSLRFAKVTSAVIVNLLLPLLFYGGFTLILLTIEGWFQIHDFGENAFYYLPYFYMGIALRRFGEGDYTITLPGVNNTGTPEVLIQFAIVAGLIHLLIAAGIVLYTAVRFNQIVGRASQQYENQPHVMPIIPR